MCSYEAKIAPKMRLGAPNVKSGPDALGTAENASGSVKREHGPDSLGTTEKASGTAKREN